MICEFYMIWAVCVAFAPLYNFLGEKIIILALIIPILINRKIKLSKMLLIGTVSFIIFMGFKMLFVINNYNPVSSFHSVYTLAFGMLELAILFLCIDSIDLLKIMDNKKYKVRIRLCVIVSFYSSLILSIIIMIIKGREFYRLNWASGGMLVAPQFYLIFNIVIGMALAYECIFNKTKRIINVFLIVIGLIYSVLANYTTQLIFYIFGIVLVFVLSVLNTKTKKTIGVIFLVTIAFLTINKLPDFILLINNTIFKNNHIMHMRLNEIYTLMRLGDAGVDLNIRLNYMKTSFHTFLDNWLFGVPFQKYNTFNTGIIVGDHSEWCDDLARYGLLGIIIWMFFIANGFKCIYRKFRLNKTMIMSYSFFIFLYGFANPIIKIFLVCGIILASSILIPDPDNDF